MHVQETANSVDHQVRETPSKSIPQARLAGEKSSNASVSKSLASSPAERRCPKLHTPSDPLTVVEANVDVGSGNAVYIRGQGDGLSWDKGQRLRPGFGGRWIGPPITPKARSGSSSC